MNTFHYEYSSKVVLEWLEDDNNNEINFDEIIKNYNIIKTNHKQIEAQLKELEPKLEYCVENTEFCKDILNYIRGSTYINMILKESNTIKGIVSFRLNDYNELSDNYYCINIIKIITVPNYGYGSKLLDKIIEISKDLNVTHITLNPTSTSLSWWLKKNAKMSDINNNVMTIDMINLDTTNINKFVSYTNNKRKRLSADSFIS